MASRCLIIANQTLGGDALDRAVQDCMARDVRLFYVLVPMTRVEYETTAWTGGFGIGDVGWMPEDAIEEVMEEDARRHEAKLAEARRRAQERLDRMIEKVESLGGQAEGEVGIEDPLEATRAVLDRETSFTEIIVSTLPSGLSRWVKMDLPNRIARTTDIPVTTVEAKA
jgi:hypothetical protein